MIPRRQRPWRILAQLPILGLFLLAALSPRIALASIPDLATTARPFEDYSISRPTSPVAEIEQREAGRVACGAFCGEPLDLALDGRLGSGKASVDTQDAWGVFRNPLEMNGPGASKNRFAFTGYVFDRETELYFAKARFYDPTVGRFTSQDSFLGEIDQPPSLHRYFYGWNRPTVLVDPSGHAPRRPQGAVSAEGYYVPIPQSGEYVEVHSDPIKQLDYEVRSGQMTQGQATMAAMDHYQEPMNEALAVYGGLYIAPAVTIAAPPALGVVGTGMLAGATTSGGTTYMRSRVRGASHGQALEAGAKAAPVGAVAGGFGAFAGGAVGGLGRVPAGFVAGSGADIAGQNVEIALGQRDSVDYGQVVLSGGVGAVASGAGPRTGTVVEDGAQLPSSSRMPSTAAERATAIHRAVGEGTQRRTTIAVTETEQGTRVVTSSERRLRPAQRRMLQEGEIEGVGAGHAEPTGATAARDAGLAPTGTAASRPICGDCASGMKEQGIDPLSPLKRHKRTGS